MKNIIVGNRNALNNLLRKFFTFIDIEERTYKLQETVLGIFKSGSFKPLPKIDYVLIFKNYFSKCAVCSIDEEENNPDSFYQVSLVHNKNRRIIVHETKTKNEAFDLAGKVAVALKIPVKDSASKRGVSKWLTL